MVGRRRGFIDLGAEKEIIAAERGKEKIAVNLMVYDEINNTVVEWIK